MKIIKITPIGMFAVNCYIVVSEAGNAVMIDCPEEGGTEGLLAELKKSAQSLQKYCLPTVTATI